jgi:hypothetical protein
MAWKNGDRGAPRDGTKLLMMARALIGGIEAEPVIGYWSEDRWREAQIGR